MKLTSIKNCHSCGKRSGCKLKQSPKNLLKTPRIFEVMSGRLMRHGVGSRKRSSFCRDYAPENPSETERIIQNIKFKSDEGFPVPRNAKVVRKPVMLSTPFHVVTKELIRKNDLTKKTEKKRWKK